MLPDALFPVITVWCFFRCGHRETGLDPHIVHAAMEGHYRDRHAARIAAAVHDPYAARCPSCGRHA